jgi:hypothetical protein
MTFKYSFLAPSPPLSASSVLVNDFQALLDVQFSVSTDIFKISEEYIFSSGSYIDLNVRIVGAVDPGTGDKSSDDFKKILFQNITHPVSIGRKFYFDNNYWITINAEAIKNLASSCVVRRLNNTLRWVDDLGNIWSEECVIDYQIKRALDQVGAANDLILPGGYITVYCQLNSKTRNIKGGKTRFLFGNPQNWICYKVAGDGVKNFLNLQTSNNNSAQLLALEMSINYVDETADDLVGGVADRYKTEVVWK